MANSPSMKRFVLDLDSDEDSCDFEDHERTLLEGEDMKKRKLITQKEQEHDVAAAMSARG